MVLVLFFPFVNCTLIASPCSLLLHFFPRDTQTISSYVWVYLISFRHRVSPRKFTFWRYNEREKIERKNKSELWFYRQCKNFALVYWERKIGFFFEEKIRSFHKHAREDFVFSQIKENWYQVPLREQLYKLGFHREFATFVQNVLVICFGIFLTANVSIFCKFASFSMRWLRQKGKSTSQNGTNKNRFHFMFITEIFRVFL